jgi:hypothetical protein
VSDENERDGHHEMRALAKGPGVRNSSRAANPKDYQPGTCRALLALAPPSGRVPRASNREAGSRDSPSNHSTEASGTQQEESAYLPVFRLRRSQDLRRPSLPAMLAYVRKGIALTV